MDVSRLFEVLTDVGHEFPDMLQDVKALAREYELALANPVQNNSAAIKNTFDTVMSQVDQSVFMRYPPSKVAILNSLARKAPVGDLLRERLVALLSVPGQSAAGVLTSLRELEAEMEAFRRACQRTATGLHALGITPHSVPAGAFEVGVLIPERLVHLELGALSSEFESWNRIIRFYQELADDEEREVKVAGIASGSYELYVICGLATATLIARTIDKVLDWYLKILQIRKLRIELDRLGAPVAETDDVKKYERGLLEKEIEQLASDLIKSSSKKVDASRRAELQTSLVFSIREIVRFVDSGGLVQVDATAPDEPQAMSDAPTDDQANNVGAGIGQYDLIRKTIEAGRALSRLPDRETRILQIENGGSEDATESPAKPSKKKH